DGRFALAKVEAVGLGRGARAPDTLVIVDLERLRTDPGRAVEAVERTPGILSVQVAEDGPPLTAYRLIAPGTVGTLVVRTLGGGGERRVRGVSEYRLSPDGARVWYVREDGRGGGDGVFVMETATGDVTPIMAQE